MRVNVLFAIQTFCISLKCQLVEVTSLPTCLVLVMVMVMDICFEKYLICRKLAKRLSWVSFNALVLFLELKEWSASFPGIDVYEAKVKVAIFSETFFFFSSVSGKVSSLPIFCGF